ncbi:MAG: hypothetical protein GXY32_09420 [Ruminococcaceae bacterium]|nr:hypothetical protein [Oscillospiraceae bacterium]
MKKSRSTRAGSGGAGIIVTVVLFVVMLAVLAFGTFGLAGRADEEGVAATYNAIERAAVLCYATEGFYPPSLTYIQEHYGVQVDLERYAVRYDAYASNITPNILVVAR